MELKTAIPVNLTENAINEIKRLMSVESFDTNNLLRLGVKGGGCSGMTYVLGFDLPTEKGVLLVSGRLAGLNAYFSFADFNRGL